MMRIGFVKNKYYTDDGTEYARKRLGEQLAKRGFLLEDYAPFAEYPAPLPQHKAVIFWDKDVALARMLERSGVRVFNPSAAIEKCDDKELSYAQVSAAGLVKGEGASGDAIVTLPKTICAPLVYPSQQGGDDAFLTAVGERLGYPLIVKENVGSLGRQVYLAHDFTQLGLLAQRLSHTRHMYMEYVSFAPGCDVRVYTVGGKALFAARRTNTADYRANAATGATMTRIDLSPQLKSQAEAIARVLQLDFGSVDFLIGEHDYLFAEANSNAYFTAIEKAGCDVSDAIADYVAEVAGKL